MTLKQLKTLSNQKLDQRLCEHVKRECEITAEIIEMIREVERRRLYLDHECTSLFQYLTEHVGYANGSAQRRIDAARLYEEVPTLKQDIASGALNLTHVMIVSKGLRQKEREVPKFQREVGQAHELLEKIKGQDSSTSQRIVAQELAIEVKEQERVRMQADGSLRVEMTFSKEQVAELQRVRELNSHTHPNPSWSELVGFLADDHLKRKDPLRFENKRKECTKSKSEKTQPKEHAQEHPPKQPKNQVVPISRSKPKQSAVSIRTKRFVHRRDKCCQWRDAKTGMICGSKFQLEVDHIVPLWAGGSNDPENLQLLCDVHNRMKYRLERDRRRKIQARTDGLAQ